MKTNKTAMILIILTMLLITANMTYAQTLSIARLDVFDTREGAFSSDNNSNTYLMNVEESQIIGIQVLALTGGIIPEFIVFDAEGNELPLIQDAFNNQQNTRVAFPEPGQYRIVVTNTFGSGDYLISSKSIRPYTPESIFISNNSLVEETFSDDELSRYWFTTDVENISTVVIYGENFEPGVIATLRNLRTNEDVGVINNPTTASIFCLPPDGDNYALEVMHDGESTIGSHSIAVVTETTTFCDTNEIESLMNSLQQTEVVSVDDNLVDVATTIPVNADSNFIQNEQIQDVAILTTDQLDTILQDNIVSEEDNTSYNVVEIYNAIVDAESGLEVTGLTPDALGNILALNTTLADDGFTLDSEGIINDLLDIQLKNDGLTVNALDFVFNKNLIDGDDGLLLDVEAVLDDLLAIDASLADDGLTLDVLSNILDLNASLDDDGLTLNSEGIINDLLDIQFNDDGLTVEALDSILNDNLIDGDNGITLDVEAVLDDLLAIDASLADDGLTLDVLSNILALNASLDGDGLTLDSEGIINDLLDIQLNDDGLTVEALDSILNDNLVDGSEGLKLDVEAVLDDLLAIDASLADDGLTLDVLSNILDLNTSLDGDGLTLDSEGIINDLLDVQLNEDGLTVEALDSILNDNLVDGDNGITLDVEAVLDELLAIDASLADDSLTLDVLSNILDLNASLDGDGLTADVDALFVTLVTQDLTTVDNQIVSNLSSGSSNDSVCDAEAHSRSNSINIRNLPTVAGSIVSAIDAGTSVEILGQSREGTWMHVRLLDGRIGYASIGVLNLAEACAEVDIPVLWYDSDQILTLEAEAGLIDGVNVQADATVGADGITVNADGTVTNITDVNASVDVNSDGVNINTGGDVIPNVDVNTNTSGGVNVDVNVGSSSSNNDDDNDSDDDDGANVDVNVGGVEVNVGVGN